MFLKFQLNFYYWESSVLNFRHLASQCIGNGITHVAKLFSCQWFDWKIHPPPPPPQSLSSITSRSECSDWRVSIIEIERSVFILLLEWGIIFYCPIRFIRFKLKSNFIFWCGKFRVGDISLTLYTLRRQYYRMFFSS